MSGVLETVNVTGTKYGIANAPSYTYGTCSTAAGTAIKTVDIPGFIKYMTRGGNSANILHGTRIFVRFIESNESAQQIQLRVYDSEAKTYTTPRNLYRTYKNGGINIGIDTIGSWPDGGIVEVIYDTSVDSTGCWLMTNMIQFGDDKWALEEDGTDIGIRYKTNMDQIDTSATIDYRTISYDASNFALKVNTVGTVEFSGQSVQVAAIRSDTNS